MRLPEKADGAQENTSIKKEKILTVELEKFPTWLRVEFYLRICREVGY